MEIVDAAVELISSEIPSSKANLRRLVVKLELVTDARRILVTLLAVVLTISKLVEGTVNTILYSTSKRYRVGEVKVAKLRIEAERFAIKEQSKLKSRNFILPDKAKFSNCFSKVKTNTFS